MSAISRLVSALVLCSLFLLGSGPLAAGTYYVATSGNDANDGKSPEKAWRTVKHAAQQAVAGDTVHIKAGLYRGETVSVRNSGTEQAPIVFQGYKDKPGEKLDAKYKPGDKLNPDALPILEGEGMAQGIQIEGKKYVEIRNLGLTLYTGYGTFPLGCQHLVFENVLIVNIGGANGGGVCMEFRRCDDCMVRNCVVADGGMGNLTMREVRNCVIDGCKSYATIFSPPLAATDYHITLGDAQNNIIRDCLAENLHWEHRNAHTGHGIGIKDKARPGGYKNPHSERNQIINCVARNVGEYLYVAHEAHHNEFINCKAVGQWQKQGQWSYGLGTRDGAHDNTFRNCRVEGVRYGVGIEETVEGPTGADQICTSNRFVNCVFTDAKVGLEMWNGDQNIFQNCAFNNVASTLLQLRKARVNTGNALRNTIVTNSPGALYARDLGNTGDTFAITYSDFWNNKFEMPAGKGNVSKDPQYADAAKMDFHLRSAAGRWDAATSSWFNDKATSPCIDAGDPSDDFKDEPQPNGGRINIGAYGGTGEASKSAAGGGR